MWALRRASNPLKFPGLGMGISHVNGAKLETLSSCLDSKASILEHPQAVTERCLFHHTINSCSRLSIGRYGFSSQAGRKSSDSEDNLEDGFSELETPASVSTVDGNEDELVSDPEVSDGNDDIEEPSQNMLELSDAETDQGEKKSPSRRAHSELYKAILDAPGNSVRSVLDKWVKEGKDLGRADVSLVMFNLRRRKLYGRALQLSEWLESSKQYDFVERDYTSRLDLIAKVHGLHKAEKYIEEVPASFRGEVIYRTLLANCVSANNLKKSEEVFNKMKDLEFPVTSFACNQLLLLYKRLDKKKIADVLLLMEKENVKPTLFTYKILIDTKGSSHDITGMDQILETMKAEGIEPDIDIQATLAKHYISGGLKEKAEVILKAMEGGNLKEHRWACQSLLPLYAALGNADEVWRIWELCKELGGPRFEECKAAIYAWGKLKKIDEAEAVFDMMLSKWKKLSSRHYSTLLKVYADHKMLSKGKDLVKRMADNGCQIGPLTWDALVKLYVQAGEVEKADSMLQKAIQQSQMKPMYSSFLTIMDQYAKRGDIHNAEKIFYRMRQAGYVSRIREFQLLIQTYINAKTPAYGIRERMKADNVFPNKALAAQLAQIDAFRKTAVSDLLD